MDPVNDEIPSPLANKNRLLLEQQYVKTFINRAVQLTRVDI